MRIAVIGSGIAGMMSAWLLSRQHDVTLYEANDYFGGHTHTHQVQSGGKQHAIDSGFIVYNPLHYPLLTRLFNELGVASKPTTMSFSVQDEANALEYSTASLNALLCQRRNFLSPRFYGMVRDIFRFYREAPQLLQTSDPGPTLADWLTQHHYSHAFRDSHLIPMVAALWSSPSHQALEFPMRYLVQFMANHQMLQIGRRSPWRVVCDGSRSLRTSATGALECTRTTTVRRVSGTSSAPQ